MSTDWWINFNHMEGLTDRCYRVTLSHESQSGDSLGGNWVFWKEAGRKWKPEWKAALTLCDFFFFSLGASFFLRFWMVSFLPDSFGCIYLASHLFPAVSHVTVTKVSLGRLRLSDEFQKRTRSLRTGKPCLSSCTQLYFSLYVDGYWIQMHSPVKQWLSCKWDWVHFVVGK